MPNSERTTMKLFAKQAIGAIEKAAAMLLRIRAAYDPQYPQYVEAIDALLAMTSEVRDQYVEFSRVL